MPGVDSTRVIREASKSASLYKHTVHKTHIVMTVFKNTLEEDTIVSAELNIGQS